MQDAMDLQAAGCFAVVFEAIPTEVTDMVMQHMDIVVLGIGAGPAADGQVLVLHDLLGVHQGHIAKFVRQFADVYGEMRKGVAAYTEAVRSREFPAPEHGYSIPPEELERLRAAPPRRDAPAYDW
jgi:3-methyl-2-oxobutanoate hydroxymethyltransferase